MIPNDYRNVVVASLEIKRASSSCPPAEEKAVHITVSELAAYSGACSPPQKEPRLFSRLVPELHRDSYDSAILQRTSRAATAAPAWGALRSLLGCVCLPFSASQLTDQV